VKETRIGCWSYSDQTSGEDQTVVNVEIMTYKILYINISILNWLPQTICGN